MRFYFIIASVVAVAAVALFLTFGADGRTVFEVLLLAIGLLPTIIRHTPSIYLRLSKLWFSLRNTPATWDLSVRFRSIATTTSTGELAERLVKRFGKGSSIVSRTNERVIMKLLGRFVLELSEDRELGVPFADGQRQIHVAVLPVTVGYRDSRKFLDKDLFPVLGAIRDELRAETVSYGLRITLSQHNPYFGLYVQQFPSASVRDFRVEIGADSGGARTHMTVRKDAVTVVSDSFEGFRELTGAALAFKVPEL
jgi:hypothetical protein